MTAANRRDATVSHRTACSIDRRNRGVQSARFSHTQIRPEHGPQRSAPGLNPDGQLIRKLTQWLEHDPEKWNPVFRKDHAPPKFWSAKSIQSEAIGAWELEPQSIRSETIAL
jgi:hypothetical protein